MYIPYIAKVSVFLSRSVLAAIIHNIKALGQAIILPTTVTAIPLPSIDGLCQQELATVVTSRIVLLKVQNSNLSMWGSKSLLSSLFRAAQQTTSILSQSILQSQLALVCCFTIWRTQNTKIASSTSSTGTLIPARGSNPRLCMLPRVPARLTDSFYIRVSLSQNYGLSRFRGAFSNLEETCFVRALASPSLPLVVP